MEKQGIWLTYDDIRLAEAFAAIFCVVALDLICTLIKQVQVVIDGKSIMGAADYT